MIISNKIICDCCDHTEPDDRENYKHYTYVPGFLLPIDNIFGEPSKYPHVCIRCHDMLWKNHFKNYTNEENINEKVVNQPPLYVYDNFISGTTYFFRTEPGNEGLVRQGFWHISK